jgi:YbbR domain-containing protein
VKNLGLKIFSLFLAIALNYYVNSENHIAVVGFTAPIKVSNIPSDKLLVYPRSPKIEVTVKGPSYLVSQVVTSNIMYELDLPTQIGNSFKTGLSKGALELPPSVEVISIEPTEVELSFDRRIEKEIPVIVPRYGNSPENIKVVGMEVLPGSVRASGPETEIKKIRAIETEPVDFRDISASFERKLDIRNPGDLISIQPTSVRYKVEIVGLLSSRVFSATPIEIRAISGMSIEASDSSVSIEVAGAADILEKLTRESLTPYVRVKDGAKVGDKLKIEVEIPDGISLKSIVPDIVKVNSITKSNGK